MFGRVSVLGHVSNSLLLKARAEMNPRDARLRTLDSDSTRLGVGYATKGGEARSRDCCVLKEHRRSEVTQPDSHRTKGRISELLAFPATLCHSAGKNRTPAHRPA